ncbi:MAG: hypothetical protein N3F07_02425 [Candidatus Micrarchaeota archaeon]|nr:hypothetical protein [Candidatus Micrarchaeota archaeon]
MRLLGFIFSLDAFVAFTLIMLSISVLMFSLGTPKPYFPYLEQARQLAHDTLQVMATTSESQGGPTYLESAVANRNNPSALRQIMFKVAGGNSSHRGIIPQGYAYKLQFYNFNDPANPVFTAYDSGRDPLSDRYGKSFSKVQASATVFASLYDVPPNPGASPFCYISCFGYTPAGPAYPCNTTPCDSPTSNFQQGKNTIQLIRLVVYA